MIDGIIYRNAHNHNVALALHERYDGELTVVTDDIVQLNDPAFRPTLLEVTLKLGLTLPA